MHRPDQEPVMVYFDRKVKAELKARAQAEERSMSYVVRAIVNEFLARDGKAPANGKQRQPDHE